MMWLEIAEEIGMRGVTIELVPGGCINVAAVLTPAGGPGERAFVKCNAAAKLPMFEQEAEALQVLAASESVRVPKVISHGVTGDHAYLALEFIPLRSGGPAEFHELGRRLAHMHQTLSPQAGRFGWTCENVIGETPQPNPWCEDWARFFAEHRIAHQLQLARSSGARKFAHGDKLLARIPDLLDGHEPVPSLLHGDLWSGNVGFADGGKPVVYDPASYYGDAETDLAFSEMFGGFDRSFYAGYAEITPPQPGYERRRDLYNLYHVLNHYNLFGGSYGDQADATIRKLLVGF